MIFKNNPLRWLYIAFRREASCILKLISIISIFHSTKKIATINLHKYLIIIMSKKTKRIQNKDDYKKSSFNDIMENMEDAKNRALESVPKIRKEQVPSDDETSTQILYGDNDNDDDDNNK
jgi:hypothetical protein